MNDSDPDSGYSLKCFMRGNISNNYYFGAHTTDERFGARNSIKKPIECEICNRTFKTHSNFKKHREVVHDPEKSHECNACSEKFRSKSRLLKHIYNIHNNDKTFECEICFAKLKSRGMLIKHRKKHTGEQTLECEICQRKYKWQSMLDKHLEAHTKELSKLRSCHLCQKKFSKKKILDIHIFKEHFAKGNLREKNVSGGNDLDIHISETKTEPCYGDDSVYEMADKIKLEKLQEQDITSPLESNLENIIVKNEYEIKIEKSETKTEPCYGDDSVYEMADKIKLEKLQEQDIPSPLKTNLENIFLKNECEIKIEKSEAKTEPCYGDDSVYKMADKIKLEELQEQDITLPLETNLENIFVKNECEIKIEKNELQYDN